MDDFGAPSGTFSAPAILSFNTPAPLSAFASKLPAAPVGTGVFVAGAAAAVLVTVFTNGPVGAARSVAKKVPGVRNYVA